jgi:hypothetical protein
MIKLLLPLLLAPVLAYAQAGDEKDLVFAGQTYPLTLDVKAKSDGQVTYEGRFSELPGKDYDEVLLQGLMPEPDMRLDLLGKGRSFFSAPVEYRQTGFRRFPNGRFWARYKAPSLTRQPVKILVTDLGLKSNQSLVIYATELLTEGELREREAPAEVSTAAYVPEPDLFVPAAAPFKLHRRAEWKANPPKEAYSRHAPYFFTLHHTQAHYPKTFDDAVIEMQFIQDFHQNGRGWNDIAYHFLIDPAGNVFEGRPINVLGSHVKNRNTGNVGISIMGNYHAPAHDKFTPLTQNSFVSVARYVKDTYEIKVSSFYAHRELGSTDCPGDDLYAKMSLLRGLVYAPQQPRPVEVPAAPVTLPAEPQAESLRQLLYYLETR